MGYKTQTRALQEWNLVSSILHSCKHNCLWRPWLSLSFVHHESRSSGHYHIVACESFLCTISCIKIVVTLICALLEVKFLGISWGHARLYINSNLFWVLLPCNIKIYMVLLLVVDLHFYTELCQIQSARWYS